MPDDIPELCCALGACCRPEKRRDALAKILKHEVPHLSQADAVAVSNWLHDHVTMVDRSLNLDDFLERFAHMAREHPYT
jgi:hypothetical protein